MNEQEKPASRWNGSTENLHGFMLAAAAGAPGRVAVVERDPDGRLVSTTYGALAARVRRYAAALERAGLDIGDRVVIESENSAAAIAMLLACSTLGLPFIPVSPGTPDKRLHMIIGDAAPALYAHAPGVLREGLPGSVGRAVFGADGLEIEHPPAPRPRHRSQALATDTAYIIFTSGTTGRPKGVVMSHRSVVAFYRAVQAERLLGPGDRVATTSPLQFDFSLFDMGFALGAGATLLLVPRQDLGWPRRFAAFLRETGATQVDGVPSVWRPALRHAAEELAGLERLRGILFSGEEFPVAELRRLQQLLPKVRFTNLYGPTESMAISLTEVPNPLPEDQERLSIGRAYRGAEMTLHDEQGRPVSEAGVVGQIHLRAPSLFTGYWGDPEGTRRVLVPDPLDPASGRPVLRTGDLAYRGPDGQLYFCGRSDSQVQIRGNRVELGEIERQLRDHPGVSSAVALLLPPPGPQAQLGAFVVTAAGAPAPDKAALRAHCARNLPPYMVPQKIFVLNELPLTANGKVDRAALLAHTTAALA